MGQNSYERVEQWLAKQTDLQADLVDGWVDRFKEADSTDVEAAGLEAEETADEEYILELIYESGIDAPADEFDEWNGAVWEFMRQTQERARKELQGDDGAYDAKVLDALTMLRQGDHEDDVKDYLVEEFGIDEDEANAVIDEAVEILDDDESYD
jgi:hypothetical protein